MRLLFIGDVMGVPGRRVLAAHLPALRKHLKLDVVIVNAENADDSGAGITARSASDLFALGIDLLSNGNHAWDRREALEYIKSEPRLLRPHNYPIGTPGSGWHVLDVGSHRVGVLNLLGNVFMQPSLACPFRTADAVLVAKPDDVKTIIVDIHAEATMEKWALGWYLDGRVSAVLGTHTHVPTADERILPGGTAYISDVGMAGCYHSVIGLEIQKTIKRMVHKLPERFDTAEGEATLCGVLIDIDPASGKSLSIRRLALDESDAANPARILAKAAA